MGNHAARSIVPMYISGHSAFLLELWGTEGIMNVDMRSKVLVNYERLN